MPYIYSKVDDLENTDKVGTKQCVALLQEYLSLPQTIMWKEGKAVLGNQNITKGTAVATFSNGKYVNHSTGNHAAFYVSQDTGGVWIMDQWANDKTKPKVSKRYVRKKGTFKDGKYVDPSNNAEAYSIIE
jgi:hypothetical protein